MSVFLIIISLFLLAFSALLAWQVLEQRKIIKQMLESEDISDEEAQAFLEALWSIIVGFVDLGFGIHPLQLIHNDDGEGSNELESGIASVVASDTSSKTQFSSAANRTKPDRDGQEES
mgnify:CR=1 FL=1